jgi:hypothetical protein
MPYQSCNRAYTQGIMTLRQRALLHATHAGKPLPIITHNIIQDALLRKGL